MLRPQNDRRHLGAVLRADFAYYGLIVWLPTYLASVLGFMFVTNSGVWTGVDVLGLHAALDMWSVSRPHRTETCVPLLPDRSVGQGVSYHNLRHTLCFFGWGPFGCVRNGLNGGIGAAHVGGIFQPSPGNSTNHPLECRPACRLLRPP